MILGEEDILGILAVDIMELQRTQIFGLIPILIIVKIIIVLAMIMAMGEIVLKVGIMKVPILFIRVAEHGIVLMMGLI
jgi:hypothetical protein